MSSLAPSKPTLKVNYARSWRSFTSFKDTEILMAAVYILQAVQCFVSLHETFKRRQDSVAYNFPWCVIMYMKAVGGVKVVNCFSSISLNCLRDWREISR